MEPPLRLLF